MIGENVLLFNHATMIKAVQEYLDKRYSEGPDPGPIVHYIETYEVDDTFFKIKVKGRPNVSQT
jgi:hypothetical protein